jgi:uncharacterized glyoxalase superfamily protein PhnB
MQDIYDTFRPPGFGSMNTYLFVSRAPAFITFLRNAFYAEEIARTLRPDGITIANAILKIGDTHFMIAEARAGFSDMRTCFYLYTQMVDSMYKNALQHGAEAVFPPSDQEYGDRQGGIKDPWGNYWWISKRLSETDYE